MRKLTVLALFTGLAVLGPLPAVPAGATPSGTNDQITFARQIPTGGANVFIANPDGSDSQFRTHSWSSRTPSAGVR